MIRFAPKKVGATLLLLLATPSVFADLLGVEDAALLSNAVLQLKQLKEQYTVLNDTYASAKSQLNKLKELGEFNSGHYGYGAFDNGLEALSGWQTPANSWKEALENIAGGNKTRYAELVKSYEESHPMASVSAFSKGATSARLHQYDYQKKVNAAVSVETTKTFNDLNARLKSINTLALTIDKTPNTKSAIDLNSRITAELAYLSVMNLKLQTLVSQQLAEAGARELAEEGRAALFNTLPH